ncbi:MAG: hypothetical protein MR938_01205 [Tenericutes bacterium]|nr:hypothetical protein [Mycoplasmatota bacterium]
MNNVIFDKEMNEKLLSGITKLYKAVSCTLGPNGRNVIISKDNGKPYITNDGVTIASSIELDDEIENIAVNLIKEAAKKTNETVGDGTTTTIILTYELYKRGLELIENGINPTILNESLLKYKKYIIDSLKKQKKNCKSKSKIKQVSSIASKDKNIGLVISELYEKVGFNNYIVIEDKVSEKIDFEIINGMKLDFGYHIESAIGENITKLELNNPLVCIEKNYINSIEELQNHMHNKKDIVIFCEDYDNEIIKEINDYNNISSCKIYLIKTLLKSDRAKSVLTDIEYYTNSFNKYNEVNKIIIEKDNTIILNKNINKEKLNERISYLKVRMNDEEFEFEKEFLQKRISSLNGKMGIIYSYGLTELERIDRKLRIEDALNTAINSYKYGVVDGSGVSLLKVSNKINESDEISLLVKSALESPYNKIIDNSGNNGINTENIIDSYKVVVEEINNSFSIACMLLTTSSLIINNMNNYSKIDIDKIM